tara:strand:- start:3123 stop:3764 length:642 start_codon:yes stop_codon:yes gene_type:complete
MISHSHKFLFVHATKTGGTSIEHALDEYNATGSSKKSNREWTGRHGSPNCGPFGRHSFLNDYIDHPKNKFSIPKESLGDYFKFSFARNPWARIFSHYRMFKRNGPYVATESIQSFVKFYCLKPHAGWRSRNFAPVLDHVFLDGSVGVDFIGKFENFEADFQYVCDKIGIPAPKLPHVNKSKVNNYVDYYNEESVEIVAKKYAKDIDYFGYKFK